MTSTATECGTCARSIDYVSTSSQGQQWVHVDTGTIRCHALDAMRGGAKPRGEYSAAGLAILDELRGAHST